MARQRKGGFKPPELRGTLGTLLRTTLQQAGAVRDAIGRSAREGRSKLDEVRSGRRRQEALAELGEIVLDLIRNGEIDLAELPEAQSLVDHLDELDAADDDEPATDRRPAATSRSRFDERGGDDGTVSSKRWSPPPRRAGRDTTVWRPTNPGADSQPEAAARAATPTTPGHRTLPRDPHRKGGIQFESDDDLADYMHPDDVPPKPPGEGES